MTIRPRRTLVLASLSLALALTPALAGQDPPLKPKCCAAAKGKSAAGCARAKVECLHALGKEAKAESSEKSEKLTKQCCIDAVKAGKDPCCAEQAQKPE